METSITHQALAASIGQSSGDQSPLPADETNLLAGAVDPSLGVHHRVQRAVTGLQQRALLDMAVDAVAETRESAGAEVDAVGFGLPALIDRRTGKVAARMPKSVTLTSPSGVTITFVGASPRCVRPRPCA